MQQAHDRNKHTQKQRYSDTKQGLVKLTHQHILPLVFCTLHEAHAFRLQ